MRRTICTPEPETLKADLRSTALILLYRLIFILYAEARELLAYSRERALPRDLQPAGDDACHRARACRRPAIAAHQRAHLAASKGTIRLHQPR